jgi:hypothetical protein
MEKISDAVGYIIRNNPEWVDLLKHDLVNMTQLANYICPLIAARTQKPVKSSAVLMALSRLKTDLSQSNIPRVIFRFDHILVQSDLVIITCAKSLANIKKINLFYQSVVKNSGYITLTEGISEISLIFNHKYLAQYHKLVSDKPESEFTRVSALVLKFSPEYLNMPGLLASVVQKIALQQIPIIEVSSTQTEFIMYLNDKDISLAFDTIFLSFVTRK